MIQRIQTVWLLVAAALAFLALRFPFYSGQKLVDNVPQLTELNASTAGNLLLQIVTVAVGLLSLVAIFLFKQRKTQMRLVIAALVLALGNIALFILETQKFVPGTGTYALTSVFVFLPPVFLVLAIRGIHKDEKLIRSLDRLR